MSATNGGGRLHLDEAGRATLAAIVAERPGASHAQVARIFEARTGRRINRCTVGKLRARGAYRYPSGNGHLTEAERETLALLYREGKGRTSWHELARQFEALAGRPITFQAAWRFGVGKLGAAKVGKGNRNRPRGEPATLARRVAEEAAGKLDRARAARAKVDRSERAGRTGRLVLEGRSS